MIEEKGFRILALEGDGSAAPRVHRYVLGEGENGKAEAALSDFKRFPQWMWRDSVVLEPLERTSAREKGELPDTFPSSY